MCDIVDFLDVCEQGVVIDEAASENIVELRNNLCDFAQAGDVLVLGFLQVVHHLEGEVEVRKQRHQEELVFDEVYCQRKSDFEQLIPLVEERAMDTGEFVPESSRLNQELSRDGAVLSLVVCSDCAWLEDIGRIDDNSVLLDKQHFLLEKLNIGAHQLGQ